MEGVDPRWVDIQKRTFTGWVNQHLKDRLLKVNDLTKDLSDGIHLINLLEIISSKEVVAGGKYNKKPKIRAHMLENVGWSLKFLKDEKIKLVAIGPEDVVDKNTKLILGMIWTIILRYHIQKGGASTSAKNDLLAWVQKQIPECNVKDFTTSWQDGKAICHLADSLQRGIVDIPKVDANPNALDNATLGENTAERELGIPKILSPEDMVSPDSDELSVMTYISYYRDYADNLAKRRSQAEKERLADASKCVALGPAFDGAEQFIPAEFYIQAKNCFGNNLDHGDDPFEVVITGPGKGGKIDVDVVDNKNGTYNCKFVPLDPGRHTVAITLGKTPIANSPYSIPVERSSITASGPGLEKAEIFLPAHFQIHARKLFDALHPSPSDFVTNIAGPKGVVPTTSLDNGDGNYDVSYTPNDPGRYTVNLSYKGRPIAGGPYHVVVDKSGVVATGSGVEKGEQFIPSEFTINAKTLHDAGVPVTTTDFAVVVNGPKGQLPTQMTDNGDGTYKVSFTPLDPGRHTINVTLKQQPIGNGPFAVPVEKSSISASGPGLQRGEVLSPAEFTINARPLLDKNVPLTLGELEIQIAGPKGPLTPQIKDNNDGTFNVVYSPSDVGRHQVSLGLKGRPIAQSPYAVPIEKSGIGAFGPGLEKAEQYIPTHFTIQAKNLADKGVDLNPDDFKVEITGPCGQVQPTITNNNDGTFNVDYTPTEFGKHKVDVQIKGQPIANGPFMVPVDKSATDPSLSNAHGPGLEPGNTPEAPAHFTIQARNKIGDPMKTGGDPFKVTVAGPYGSEPPVKVVDNKDGTYSVTYEPNVVGEHKVDVTLNNIPIKDAPFFVNIERGENDPDPANFIAYGPGLEGGNNVEPAVFTVQSANSKGEKLHTGGHPVEVEVFGPNGAECQVSVHDNNDGTYTVQYQPVDPGNHRVDVVLKSKIPMYYDHIRDSPFTVPIVHGTDPSKSKCYGPGLTEAYDTLPAEFKIQAKDRDGNNMPHGGDPFEVNVTGPSGPVPVEIKDNGDGTYDVVYNPTEHGPHDIDVKLRGKPVGGGPYHVDVKQGADHEHSLVELYSFVIRAKTKSGDNKPVGGDNFTCTLTGPSGEDIPIIELKDIGDGTYLVRYTVAEHFSGELTISVKVNGKDIRGSPWKQIH
eukprot:TRINITY_DN938_c0_g1_i1.p1 TRINITY_DN938_c0_g1~~TRINITY_DN938_c0_g1_i1.p1  ORF type:complete len:1157 (+),score=374.89 TRINITY_DN938_c0_g1_i1:50-3472(+)